MGNFLYACVQLVHNLGAVAVVGSPAVAWWLAREKQAISNPAAAGVVGRPAVTEGVIHNNALAQRKLAWLVMLAWSAQAASGVGFGVTTYYLKHELPDLTGVGLAALEIKAACALTGFVLALLYLRTAVRWSAQIQLRVWQILFILGLTALMSAAFLRWYA